MLGYNTGKGLAWKWSEPLGRWGQSGGGRGVQSTETNCGSFPGYIGAGCVREIGRVAVHGESLKSRNIVLA